MIIQASVALVLTIAATTAASADHHRTGMHSGHAVNVAKAWARASVGKNGAAYFTVLNKGKADAKEAACQRQTFG